MPTCKKCDKQFPNHIWVDGQRKKLDTRRYCLECSPYKAHNTRDLTKEFKDSRRKNAEYMLNYFHKRSARKLDLVVLKGGECQQCGYSGCLEALVFHHRDPSTKSFSLSREYIWKASWDRLVGEADKCDLLCNRCHAELHAKELKSVEELLEERASNSIG